MANSHTYIDNPRDLIINTMTKQIYLDLSSDRQIYDDQLYLIDDENFDVFNKRIVNLNQPESQTDAVNLEYLSSYYIEKDNIIKYVDNTKIYSYKDTKLWPNGTTYIQGDKKIFKKSTLSWDITVIKGNTPASDIQVIWTSTFGWRFKIGSDEYGQNFIEFPDKITYNFIHNGVEHEVVASSWHYEDELVGKSEIYSAISSINNTSTFENVRTALINLVSKVHP